MVYEEETLTKLVMKLSHLVLIPILALVGCSEEPIIEVDPALVIGDPLDCGIENTLMFPIGRSCFPTVIQADVTAVGNATDMQYNGVGFVSNVSTVTAGTYQADIVDRWAKVEYTKYERKHGHHQSLVL